MTLSSGTQFGSFRILGPLGQGAMATVYLAEQATPSRLVALKIIDEELGATPEFRLRFQREANILALLEHPNIVPVWEAGEIDGRLFISSRYVRGGTLRELLGQPLSYEETIRYLSPVADALDYAHRRNVVHRDIKPSNILVTEPDDAGKRSLIVADFGIAKLLAEAGGSTEFTGTGMAIGTVAYMAPEQFGGQPVDGRADQYALAIVAYQMLTGSVPFTGTLSEMAAKVAVAPPPAPSGVNPQLPKAVDRVLATALAKRPEDRYPSCSAFVAALDAALLPGAHQGQGRGATATAGSNRGLMYGLIGAAVAAVAAIAVLVAVLASHCGSAPPAPPHNNQVLRPTPGPTHASGPVPVPSSPTPTLPTATPRPAPPTATPTQQPPAPYVAAAPNVVLNAIGQSSLVRQLLPSRFSVSSIDSISVTQQAAQNRAVGDMQFTINGPDNAGDWIDFVGFTNHNDALAYLSSVSETTDPVTMLDLPSGCAERSDTANGKAVGLTNCYAVVGNTVIRTLTQVYGTQGYGNGPNNDTMTRAAVAALMLTVLQQTQVPANQFPYVIAPSQFQTLTLDLVSQQRNAAGGVTLSIPGGDTHDEADYYVFQTDQDAAGFLHDRGQSTDANLSSLGYPYTCISFDGSAGGQSDCLVQIGTVVVRGSTRIASHPGSANPQLAAQIATAGVRFLQAVEAIR